MHVPLSITPAWNSCNQNRKLSENKLYLQNFFCSQNIIKVFKIRISFHGFLPTYFFLFYFLSTRPVKFSKTFAFIRDKHCWNLSWQIISVINGVIKVGNHKSIERPKGYLPSPEHTKPHLPQPCFMLDSMIEY